MNTVGEPDAPPSYEGACLCGATHFEVAGSLSAVVLCHCTQCRRGNGGAFNVSVVVNTAQVIFRSLATLKEYESSPGKVRAFCGVCGSPIYSRRSETPNTMRLRGGLIVDLPAPLGLRHIHRDSRWPWIDTIESAPMTPEG
ncbi:GFA family protein [uncultured Sphingomonas sp.]|uniref:GFA family protein n=1 Tax=uncultured Sphingomonas sp. TaxID=158754 RepID=UPI0035CC19C3